MDDTYKCIICEQSFKRKNIDDVQRVIHTDIFKKVCPKCFKKYVKYGLKSGFYIIGRGSRKTLMAEEIMKFQNKEENN